MKRDFRSLDRSSPFDLIVVGGGIYGAWVAYDAALRGLDVALVERTDWGAGTSSASSKLIHGGLRYLENYHFALVRKSLQERRRLLHLAPHQVRRLRFLIPNYRGDRVGRLRLRAGLTLYDLLAGRVGDEGGHRSLDREEVLAGSGFLEDRELLGGLEYGDSVMDDARITVEVVSGAMKAGAVAVNHASAKRLLVRRGAADGVEVVDGESDEVVTVRARVIVNAAGPWAADLLPEGARRPRVRFQKGIHLVMPSLGVDHALLVMARADGRPYFLIPWYGRTLLGTTDTLYRGDPGDVRVEPADAEYLLRDAARIRGDRAWQDQDVVGSYAGLRTLQERSSASPGTASREWSLLSPLPGLLMPVGGKYTAARADAAQIVDRAAATLGLRGSRGITDERPLPWRPDGDFETWRKSTVQEGTSLGLDEETAGWAVQRFGTEMAQVYRRVADTPDLAERIDPEVPFCLAEVVHAAGNEMARSLDDILRRRAPVLLLSRPRREVLERVAALAGHELGWTVERRQAEVNGILQRYRAGRIRPS